MFSLKRNQSNILKKVGRRRGRPHKAPSSPSTTPNKAQPPGEQKAGDVRRPGQKGPKTVFYQASRPRLPEVPARPEFGLLSTPHPNWSPPPLQPSRPHINPSTSFGFAAWPVRIAMAGPGRFQTPRRRPARSGHILKITPVNLLNPPAIYQEPLSQPHSNSTQMQIIPLGDWKKLAKT